ncbi:MAG: hypothetical protein ACFFEF_07715, partial [Candidatus Thorarchaeota archaeon]
IYFVAITLELQLVASLVIYGIISGGIMPLMLVVMMDLPSVGAEYTGVASGLFFSLGPAMGVIGPILVGYMTDLYGSFLPALIMIALVVEFIILLAFAFKEN